MDLCELTIREQAAASRRRRRDGYNDDLAGVDPSGGGESRATLKKGMELEFAEFCMAFLDGSSRFTTGQFVAYAGGWA